ncbi:MAG: rhomboid family intramembrane serine protease [Phycisphaerae bacterium]
MGIWDRPYMHDRQGRGGQFGGMGGMRLAMPRPPSAVKVLLLVNVAVFILQYVMSGVLEPVFGVTVGGWWQAWRYITFQFLHSTGGIGHILINMLFLYFLGTILERTWGTRRFVWFYLTCGVGAGVSYAVMGTLMNLPGDYPLIGASGGVYGILVACAMFFPHIRVLVFFMFPVSIRVVALISIAIMSMTVLSGLSAEGARGAGFWSEVAHFGGVAVAALWILPMRFRGGLLRAGGRLNRGAWEKRMRQQTDEQAEIDRILRKINDQGISSLTRKEKRTLQDATRRQQEEDRKMHRL